jgi:hypothetical protein
MGVRIMVTCDRCGGSHAQADHDSPTTDDAVRAVNRVLESDRWISDRGSIVCSSCSAGVIPIRSIAAAR